jgi:adenine/guanine phosphoribosyltransferase-like PRPP-binding protein
VGELENVVIVDEYIETGKTATGMENRTAFQSMHGRIKRSAMSTW